MEARKLLAGILTAAMVFSSMALPAFAEETKADDAGVLMSAESEETQDNSVGETKTVVAKIGDKEYTDLATALNAATSGATVVLQENITLTGVWTPIAEKFEGTLEGNNKTISGLNITTGDSYIGLFASLYGGTVKDLVIDGANINTNAQYVGALFGNGWGTITNCTVSNSTITGKDQVGGLGGYLWIGTITNCKLTNNTIKATEERAGGILGKGNTNSADSKNGVSIKDCTVSGGSATAPDYAGGLMAQFMGNQDAYEISGNKVTDFDLKAPKTSAFATIRDGQNDAFLNALATNVHDNEFIVASIGDADYNSLSGALTAAQDGDTVKLLCDVTLTDNITLSSKGNITLDLGGHTLTHNGDNGPAYGMIVLQDGANLEIKNGSIAVELVRDEKGEYKSGSQSSIDVGAGSSLTVEDITLDAVAANSVFAAHDGGSIVINDGNYKVTDGGVVVFAYGDGTKVEINGGTFTGTDESEGAVYAFNGANVTVNDGSFNFSDDETDYSAYGLAKGTGVNWLFCDYSGLIGYPFSGMNVRVASEADISVTGGTYNKDISSLGNLSWSREDSDIKFASKKVNYLAKGKMLKDNNDGTYTVEDIEAKLNNTNVTTEEKVDTINSVVVNEAVAETIVKTIEKLPVDKQEEIAPTKVAEILGAVSSATTEDKVVTKKSTESGESETGQSTEGTVEVSVLKSVADTITITEKQATDDGAKEIKLPSSQTAKFFDVTLTKTTTTTTTGGGGSASETTTVTETSVPVLLKFYVGENAANVKSVFRYHNGVQENLAFDRTDDGYILVASNKFSIVGYTFGTAITDGSAEITFEQDATNANVYNIYLKGAVDATVANFESGQFTIVNTASSGKVGMVLEGAKGDDGNNALLIIDEVAEGSYKIHRPNGAVDYPTVDTTNHKILLGTLTLTGTGKGQIYADNIKMYKKSTTDSLVDEISTTSDSVNYNITAETADLTVKVTFPNAVENQVAAYQDMKITISGGDLAEPLSYNLGSDASGNVVWSNTEDAVYTLTVADKLTQNVAYTVKVEGAGYRTARYTVNMTGAKTLNFWNNVKDTAVCVEASAGTARKTTFLAGDIVKDNQINIYDLSAVVSYFGQTGIGVTQASNYAKYDLNRDGKIDSKDIAYVLVSWGN